MLLPMPITNPAKRVCRSLSSQSTGEGVTSTALEGLELCLPLGYLTLVRFSSYSLFCLSLLLWPSSIEQSTCLITSLNSFCYLLSQVANLFFDLVEYRGMCVFSYLMLTINDVIVQHLKSGTCHPVVCFVLYFAYGMIINVFNRF